MLPQFEGLDQQIPRPIRKALSEAVTSGAITIEHLVLPAGEVGSSLAREHLADRWTASSPLHRAARAVVADWERRGIDPRCGHLHGADTPMTCRPPLSEIALQIPQVLPSERTRRTPDVQASRVGRARLF
jgi:hypothetical protein